LTTGPVALRLALAATTVEVVGGTGAAVALVVGVAAALGVGAALAVVGVVAALGVGAALAVVGVVAAVALRAESTTFCGVEWKTATPVRPATVLARTRGVRFIGVPSGVCSMSSCRGPGRWARCSTGYVPLEMNVRRSGGTNAAP